MCGSFKNRIFFPRNYPVFLVYYPLVFKANCVGVVFPVQDSRVGDPDVEPKFLALQGKVCDVCFS